MKLIKLIFLNIILHGSSGFSFDLKENLSENYLDEQCSDRWQFIDQFNLRITFDWQIKRISDEIVIEFRPNLIAKGFWHGFAVSSSLPNQNAIDSIYALRWQNNEQNITWETYQWIHPSNITKVDSNNETNVIFQPLFSSGLLTVQLSNLSIGNESNESDDRCWFLIYLRGRIIEDEPNNPDEIRFNQSLCFSCLKNEEQQTTSLTQTTEVMTSHILSTMLDISTITSTLSTRTTTTTTTTTLVIVTPQIDQRTEVKMIWIGRLINHVWSYDYSNLSSSLTEQLRLQLQNLFIRLINTNSSSSSSSLYSLILTKFNFFSLHPRTDSLLFAINITLLSNQSPNQTLFIVKTLVQSFNVTFDYSLTFDVDQHSIRDEIDSWSFVSLFERLSSSAMADNLENQRDMDLTLHLLLGSIVGIACFIIVISSLLCLYGYYKCQRRRFRLFIEEQTMKIQTNRNTYKWLGQTPSIDTNSGPYFIQSTSI